MALSIFRGSLTSSQAIGNMQWRNEAIAAANEAIDRAAQQADCRDQTATVVTARSTRAARYSRTTSNGDGNNEIARRLPDRQRRDRPAVPVRVRPIPVHGARVPRVQRTPAAWRVPAPAASRSRSRRRSDADDRSAVALFELRVVDDRSCGRCRRPARASMSSRASRCASRPCPSRRLRVAARRQRTAFHAFRSDALDLNQEHHMNRTSTPSRWRQFGRRGARGGRRAWPVRRCRHRHLREQRRGAVPNVMFFLDNTSNWSTPEAGLDPAGQLGQRASATT